MSADFDIDPATVQIIAVLRAVLVRSRQEGVPHDSVCGALLSETVNALHETYGPERAALMLRAAAEMAQAEPARGHRLN